MTTTHHSPPIDHEQSPSRAAQATAPTWVSSRWRGRLDLTPDAVQHLLGDVGTWALWQKGIVRAERLQGRASEPGLLACIRMGTHRLGIEVPYMLIARSASTFVFAGGWRRHVRFIDVFAVDGDDRAATVTRHLQVGVSGTLRLLRPLIAGYVRLRARSAFSLFD